MSTAVTQQPTDFLPQVGNVLNSLVDVNGDHAAAPTFTSQALKSRVVIYYLGPSATDAQRRLAIMALTLCGRCTDERPGAWQSFVISFSALCFPELVDRLKADGSLVDYEFSELSKDFLKSVHDAAMAQTKEETAGDQFIHFPPNLPDASLIPINVDLVSASQIEGLYSYYSMLVFIMGKSIGANNLVSLSTQRPMALIRKRGLTQCEFLLTGGGKPASTNYARIQSGWIRSTRPRIVVVQHLALLVASPAKSETLDTLCVNMDMLRNSGQVYIYHIFELLTACPWAMEIPALRAAFFHYARMVNILKKQPEWFRPYYKLAYQDSTKDVRRKEIESLIGVSTFFAVQTKKTMSQYRINRDTIPVIQAFIALAATKGYVFQEVANQQTTESTTV